MFGTGEALAVQLFFWTITITALAMYATQAGWTHRLFLHGLLLIAVVTFFIGAFWGRLGGIVPAASSFLTGAVLGCSFSYSALFFIASTNLEKSGFAPIPGHQQSGHSHSHWCLQPFA